MILPAAVVALLVGAALLATRRPEPMATDRVSWAELSASRTAQRLGIDNTIPPIVRSVIQSAAGQVIDPLRAELGDAEVRITSAYRSPALNEALPRASPRSKHLQGRAFDLAPRTLTPQQLADAHRRLRLPGRVIVYADHIHIEL